MQCTTRTQADVLIAGPQGRIDFAGAQVLEACLEPALSAGSQVRAIVVDLAQVDYISSVGLRVLMVAAKALRARNGAIAVAALQPVVAEIFEISRFHHVVGVHATLQDALAAVSPADPPASAPATRPADR